RTSWRAVASSTFDSMEAMQRNRDQARSIRTNGLRDLGADQLDVGEFELAIAQLRCPSWSDYGSASPGKPDTGAPRT
ncbi:hypothetical protein I553_3644, partial [Mycobacterium xenopi 4042]